MTVHSFFECLLCFTYVNRVTHRAFYLIDNTFRPTFTFVDAFSKDLMDRECNFSFPSKVNGKCVYKSKCRSKCIIYQVECSPCDAIYIGNTQHTFKKMDGNFSDLLFLLKNVQKSDSFAAHFEQHFNTTMSRTYLRKYMTFKVVNQLNPIGAMKTFTKPNCNLCMEERLTILKKIRDKRVTIMNKNSKIYGAFRHKTTFH